MQYISKHKHAKTMNVQKITSKEMGKLWIFVNNCKFTFNLILNLIFFARK